MAKEAKKTYTRKAKATSQKDKTNAKATQKNVEAKSLTRDVKYLFPEDCTTIDRRKAFRTSARAKLATFYKQEDRAEGKEKTAIKKEREAFMKATFVKGIKFEVGKN
jgi:hypothetical protein